MCVCEHECRRTYRGTFEEHPHSVEFVKLPLYDGPKEQCTDVSLIDRDAFLEALVCLEKVADTDAEAAVKVPEGCGKSNEHVKFFRAPNKTASRTKALQAK